MFAQKHSSTLARMIAAVMLLAILSSQPGEAIQQTNRPELKLPLVNARILVRKGDRKLELYSQDVLLRTYNIGLGFSPVADKKQEGDGATPEGEF